MGNKVKISIEYEDGESSFEIKKGTLKYKYDTGDGFGWQDDASVASTFDIIPMAEALSAVSTEFSVARDGKTTAGADEEFGIKAGFGCDEKTIIHPSYWGWGVSVEIMSSDGAGFARISYAYENRYWFLSDLFVDNDSREHGIASMILKEARLISRNKPIHYVLGGSLFVHEWLRKNGFVCDGFKCYDGLR